jgi:hypothetical protein
MSRGTAQSDSIGATVYEQIDGVVKMSTYAVSIEVQDAASLERLQQANRQRYGVTA